MKSLVRIFIPLVFLFYFSSCTDNEKESFAYGNFEADELLVPTEASGIVLEMKVDQGDQVQKSDIIARIDTTQDNLQLKQILASRKAVLAKLEQINSQIEVQNVQIRNLEREYERFGTLFLEDAGTKKQMDDIEGQLELARAQQKSLQSQKLSVYAEKDARDAQADQVREKLKRTQITSPAPGRILEKFVNAGEMAVAGRPIVKIANLSELILRVFVDGDQMSEIKLGDRVEVLFDGPEGLLTTEGEISWISPEAEFTPKIIQTRENRVNLVYAVKVRVSNDGQIKIGMPGEIQLIN